MNSAQVISLFTQSLVKIGPDMRPVNDLAIQHSDIGSREFRFKLPPNANFHDGSVLDCEDVLASFEQASGEGSRIRSSFEIVSTMKCESPLDFVVQLSEAKASFLAADLAMVKIIPKEIASSTDRAAPIGSGPYKFYKRENRDIIFKKFHSFIRYENGKKVEHPYFFDTIVVRSIQDPTTRWLSLRSGEVDALINALSAQKVEEARLVDSLIVHEKAGNSFQYLGMNLRLDLFKNPKVRQAIAHSIDRDTIIEHKLNNLATLASSVLSPLNYYHRKDLPNYPFNLDKARSLLKEAGIQNPQIELKTSTDKDMYSIILVIQDQLEKAGFKVSLRPYEFATFFSDVKKGNFEMFSLRWVSVVEPDILYKIFHSSQTPPGRNRVYFEHKEFDALVEKGARESDIKKRKIYYDKAQEIVARELPYIPLWYPKNIAVTSSRIKDFDLSPIGTWDSLVRARKE